MEKLRDILGDVKGKNIVFLQGPMGGFFKKLQLDFSKDNKVFHIGFNKGDEFYSVKNNYHAYRDVRIIGPAILKNLFDQIQ